jgi:hypothetical protein
MSSVNIKKGPLGLYFPHVLAFLASKFRAKQGGSDILASDGCVLQGFSGELETFAEKTTLNSLKQLQQQQKKAIKNIHQK